MVKLVQQDTINIRGTLLDLSSPKVMGILNITTDSFYDGGAYTDLGHAEKQVAKMLQDGADIIDVGGASSRPGAESVDGHMERDRVLPVIEMICQKFPDTVISIDTNNAQTAHAAVKQGAHIVNDISAGDDDADMLATVGALKVPYIAMHKQGRPQNHARKSAIRRCCLRHCAVLLAKTRKIQTTWHRRLWCSTRALVLGKRWTITTHCSNILKQYTKNLRINAPILVGVSSEDQ